MTESINEPVFAVPCCNQVDGNRYDEMATLPRLIVEASVAPPEDTMGRIEATIHLELDTGSEITMIPADSVRNMHLRSEMIVVKGFSGKMSLAKCSMVSFKSSSLDFESDIPVGLMRSPCGLVGRDVLNRRILVLNGPGKCWCCRSKPCDIHSEQGEYEEAEVAK